MNKDKLNIAIAGIGVVGSGVGKILLQQRDLIAKRAQKEINIVAISSRDKNKKRDFDTSNCKWFDNPLDLCKQDNIDVIVELIGGSDGVALQLCQAALSSNKSFVTANKALLAKHGNNLGKIAEENNLHLKFEAAVAGGIPIIKTLREGLAANNITKISGILNGTCNYILSKMQQTSSDFAPILAEAQKLGYAEADPSFDVDGIDTAHKLSILCAIAFGHKIDLESMYIEGITKITIDDIKYAHELNYKIKLLGTCAKENNKSYQYVYPALVSINSPVAAIDGVTNAVFIEANSINKMMLAGPGAGSMATASAVVADIIDIARNNYCHAFTLPSKDITNNAFADIKSHSCGYYLRIPVIDRPGVFAKISDILSAHSISMEAILQKPAIENKDVDIVFITHKTDEINMQNAVDKIRKLEYVLDNLHLIRIESI